MLILTRKAGQRIMIDDDIEVVVLGSHGGRVRLGLVAPDEVPIRREELFRRANPTSGAPSLRTGAQPEVA